MQEKKYVITNNATVICELLKLAHYIDEISKNIVVDCINFKAITTKAHGLTERAKVIAAKVIATYAIRLIESS